MPDDGFFEAGTRRLSSFTIGKIVVVVVGLLAMLLVAVR
jgi:hypothetical protein